MCNSSRVLALIRVMWVLTESLIRACTGTYLVVHIIGMFLKKFGDFCCFTDRHTQSCRNNYAQTDPGPILKKAKEKETLIGWVKICKCQHDCYRMHLPCDGCN